MFSSTTRHSIHSITSFCSNFQHCTKSPSFSVNFISKRHYAPRREPRTLRRDPMSVKKAPARRDSRDARANPLPTRKKSASPAASTKRVAPDRAAPSSRMTNRGAPGRAAPGRTAPSRSQSRTPRTARSSSSRDKDTGLRIVDRFAPSHPTPIHEDILPNAPPDTNEYDTIMDTLHESRPEAPKPSQTTPNTQNWYPFHMSRARNEIQSKYTNCFIQLLDARCPYTSYNPSILSTTKKQRPIVSLCYKSDLAQIPSYPITVPDTPHVSWLSHNASQSQINQLTRHIERITPRKFKTIPLVSCIVGIPNVGKSSFINLLAQKHRAQKGDLPGVTKRITGYKVTPDLMILDTPGILMPRIDSQDDRLKLMLINAITEKMVDYVDLVRFGLRVMNKKGFTREYMREYGFSQPCDDVDEFLLEIAKKHSFREGERWDKERAAELWVRKFRVGGFGRVFLDDTPSELVNHERWQVGGVGNLSPILPHIEHVYIDANVFVYMSEFTANLKLLKQQAAVDSMLIEITEAFTQRFNIRRCNLVYDKLSKHQKELGMNSGALVLRDKGKYASTREHLLWLVDEYAHQAEEREKRLFVTADEETAQQVHARGYRVVHLGDWLEYVAREVYEVDSMEEMCEEAMDEL